MKEHHVFPWWAGYFLISPFRKWTMDPVTLLEKYITPGMKLLDAGCAMGFFSIPMAELTGNKGKVFCADPQARMLKTLDKRAQKKEFGDVIVTRECDFNSLMLEDLSGQIDLAFSYAVLHEVADKSRFIKEIYQSLKPKGTLIFGEPHVIKEYEFLEELEILKEAGFTVEELFKKGNNNFAVVKKK